MKNQYLALWWYLTLVWREKRKRICSTHLHDRVLTSLTRLKNLCRLARRCQPPGRLLVEHFVPFPFLHLPVAIVDPYFNYVFFIYIKGQGILSENLRCWFSVNFSAGEILNVFALLLIFVLLRMTCHVLRSAAEQATSGIT